MMKIVTDENIFIIPLISSKLLLISNGYKKEIIECLSSYFISNRKNRCIIYDDDGIKIDTNDINFIYLSDDISLNNNLSFNHKTITNNEVSEIIKTNPEMFLSIDRIRKGLVESITDEGMIRLKKVLGRGIIEPLDIKFQGLDINLILQMFAIESDLLTDCQKQLVILNLLLYINRNKVNIVYLDKNIDDDTMLWMENIDPTSYFIVDNEALSNYYKGFSLVLLSNEDHVMFFEDTDDRINVLSYMNHEIIKTNMSLQKDKNVEIFDQYNDQSSTIFIRNFSNETIESL